VNVAAKRPHPTDGEDHLVKTRLVGETHQTVASNDRDGAHIAQSRYIALGKPQNRTQGLLWVIADPRRLLRLTDS
jgi:hypothetical protein